MELIGLPLEVIPATLSGADALTQLEQQGIPRWPLLTAKERAHEDAFLSEIEAPGAMSEVVERFTAMSTDSAGVMVFEVDGAKKLYAAKAITTIADSGLTARCEQRQPCRVAGAAR